MNLVLIGYRGTGKSTVARTAGRAARLALVRRRRRDRSARRQVDRRRSLPTTAKRPFAISETPGRGRSGGARAARAGPGRRRRDAARRTARRSCRQGRVVWLHGLARDALAADRRPTAPTAARRPNLTAAGGITEIIATLDARREVYRQCAHLEVDTKERRPPRWPTLSLRS